jgi:hypothetical protein
MQHERFLRWRKKAFLRPFLELSELDVSNPGSYARAPQLQCPFCDMRIGGTSRIRRRDLATMETVPA